MKVGGNRNAKAFFNSQSDYDPGMSLIDKYNSKAAALYRDKVSQHLYNSKAAAMYWDTVSQHLYVTTIYLKKKKITCTDIYYQDR